ncbi:lethal(3)malignant brain tumor-like protein 3 isoform X2 [Chelonus insularis]|nr:lethal(3)malignant brain tumor-like protein 3 isoform X2 [Chelonus insularis]XP_034934773.1 lethal(3)malignant brain tumor-like protein 3 isoform X2 [Chelonus insularis]XP_034934774.1 lethal(3)malignant brain tumor-like protein 3 isoform X2 [Chelonus insularis]XP_034934775.1 lethal(3)malignant brain tumor-like protein 3 isoform X2 [Chelonus insularis]
MGEEEIVIDDADECSNFVNTQRKKDESSSTQVMPLLYFQPSKIRSNQPTTSDALTTSSAQITTIINPINNSIVTSQNKVFIQGQNLSQSKQHFVLRRSPVTSINTTTNSANQGQKQILFRKSNVSTAQILPLSTTSSPSPSPLPQSQTLSSSPPPAPPLPLLSSTSVSSSQDNNSMNNQSGKHAFAYLGTLIKPTNKPRESVVIPAGAISSNQISKQKLVIAPVITSSIPQNSTNTTSGSQLNTPIAKHMTNLLLPVTAIPQQILRESKNSNSSANPPPLHPINKIGNLLSVNKQNNNNTTDSIKITENPDSAVITPIPKKDDNLVQPEKRKKTISNILRGSGEKRIKKQSLPKSNDFNDNAIDETSFMSSQNTTDDLDKEKKSQNDDDITLIKVVPSQEKKMKTNQVIDDDIKIEMIKTTCVIPSTTQETRMEKKNDVESNAKTESNELSSNKVITVTTITTTSSAMTTTVTTATTSSITNTTNSSSIINNHFNNHNHYNNDPNFDVNKALEWKDGVGTLPGSTLKFRINEFGLMEVVDDDENNKQDKQHISIGDKENVCLLQNSSKSVISNTEKKNEDKKIRNTSSADTFYCCESCGCHGLAAEFESPISCSPDCTERIEAKKQHQLRREKEARDLRAKRKRKKLLQEQLAKRQEQEDKDVEKTCHPENILTKSETDEDSKDTTVTTLLDDESQSDPSDSRYPWQKVKSGFSWAKYLDYTKAKAAPLKLFKDPFPYGKNAFKVGMKLEGIDPEHPARYCVLTVSEVVGYRLRLHFDGYPENFDFWVNADSMDIFPVTWTEKTGHKLDPPKGYVPNNFNWPAYLKICKATPAPRAAFACHKSVKSTVYPTMAFRVGMKLEAIDRKHSSLVCVASIADIMDSRILIHFDSWDEVYDYWADASSPYIHPIGWTFYNGQSLTPPNNYKDQGTFNWDTYLRDTRSLPAPARAFKQRPPCGFKRGMKLEAVDKRVPQLIRVATVEDVKDHMIKIHFDGWPENHAYWVDDDSPDIHPMGWCFKTGHPLEPPLTPEAMSERTECGTPGCRGIGHIKGPKYATHNSPSGCPYSPQNLQKTRMVSDRLWTKNEIYNYDEDSTDKPKLEKTILKVKANKQLERVSLFNFNSKTLKYDRDTKQEDDELSDKNEKVEISERSGKSKHFQTDIPTDDDEHIRRKRKRNQTSEERSQCSLSNNNSITFGGDTSNNSISYTTNISDKQLRTELYQSVYNPGYNPLPDAPHVWAKHSNALNRVVSKQNTNPRRWSNEEVIKFIQSVPNCKDVGSIFRQHSIDGEAFLMLTQDDLVTLLGLRLGPAIKLYNSIVLLRQKAT